MKSGKIIGSAPILLVKDVVASANYFKDKVGFQYDRFWGEPPCFCILWRDNFHLMLSQVDDVDSNCSSLENRPQYVECVFLGLMILPLYTRN